MSTAGSDDLSAAQEDARKAAELAHSNIQRFLDLQAERDAALIMRAHQAELTDAADAARSASETASMNIRRFLDLQAEREGSLIMRAHQASEGVE